MDAMKIAMKAKDAQSLEALRAVKAALLIAQAKTGSKEDRSEEEEVKILQKLVKQRKDSAVIYKEQNRNDLAEPEIAQALIIERFLPEQMSDEDVEKVVVETISETGATSMADMGKVMGIVSGKLAGKADGKTISTIVKKKLS